MTQLQTQLIAKWRGYYDGPRIVFPTSWHKKMYYKELTGVKTTYKKRPQIINNFFRGVNA